MLLLDLTLATPEENLALDEALLDAADEGSQQGEILRFWEPPETLVVLGRSSKAEVETNCSRCNQAGATVLRRCSGGAAVVAGPGCLMYALVLSYELHPELRALDLAHRYVLSRLREAILPLVAGVQIRGTSDLAVGEQKFSGNSLRCKRGHLLYHGTLLYDFDLALLEDFLTLPPRQPAYRQGRGHGEFVTNLPVAGEQLKRAIAAVFGASERLAGWPRERMQRLVRERYSQEEWNLRH
jgi:lipoate-protein ligase A